MKRTYGPQGSGMGVPASEPDQAAPKLNPFLLGTESEPGVRNGQACPTCSSENLGVGSIAIGRDDRLPYSAKVRTRPLIRA